MSKKIAVAIGGCTQSGKTTFAKELEEKLAGLRIKIFHMDYYFKPDEERPRSEAPYTKKIYMDSNKPESFFMPRLRKELIDAVIGNNYDVVIVEGTMVLHDKKILAAIDLKIFVDTRPDERAVRYIEKYSEWYGREFVRDSYIDLVRFRMDEYVEPTKWKADMIINGSVKSGHAAGMAAAYIKDCLR
ncbi:MAG: AAA family ATPase [Defluviitaleaceae bacterium]|nr:AAA family ATPase [Defluviitaleaceae bacterium]